MWYDFFKVFTYAFADDPLSKKEKGYFSGAGSPQPENLPDLRAGGAGGGALLLRDTNEFIDLSTVTNRMHRYKEYERLRAMSEIDMAMTIFADEACIAGKTKIATLTYGYLTIEELVEKFQPDERFLVYCWDFEKNDFTLGWAFHPRKTKTAEVIEIVFDDGTSIICTPDHRILQSNKTWKEAGEFHAGEEVLAFHRIDAKHQLNNLKKGQFPRVHTHTKGWIHERQFIDEWKTGKDLDQYEEANKLIRMIVSGLSQDQIEKLTGYHNKKIQKFVEDYGFSHKELMFLNKYNKETRRIVGVYSAGSTDVYDLSVENHENFCTDWGVVHNCQKDDDGRTFKIITKNQDVKDELEFLLFHRKMLRLDQKTMWNKAKSLFSNGDYFEEVLIDPEDPKKGIKGLGQLPADSMYRIETNQGRLVEFQQSKEGPDYQSIARVEVTKATESELMQATAIRMAPHQVLHTKIGDDRKTFAPYGVSLIEAARGPAHQLRLMEDAMVVYRLTRAPERRIFYIDVKGISNSRVEGFMERMKSQFRKKKTTSYRGGMENASAVEERWHAPAADEDYWVPLRSNDNTRIETLPGAQNLGEIDDTVYFRNKLFFALNFPRNYFNNEDPQSSRVSLSSQDAKFARMIERLQSYIEDTLWEICDRHLKLRGYPEEVYEDLEIRMTPPSDHRELSRAEVVSTRIQNAGSLKGAGILPDYDILTETLHYSEDDAKMKIARLKIQKLEELKMQIVAQNPAFLGAGVPGPDEEHISTEPSEETPMPGGELEQPNEEDQNEEPSEMTPPQPKNNKQQLGQTMIPQPSEEDIKKYNLDIKDYGQEMDREEVDFSQF